MKRVLYITYDGLTDPLGRTQVLPYVAGLAKRGWPISVVSFEKPEIPAADRAQVGEELARANVEWIPLRYHKTPTVPATAMDIGMGVLSGVARRLVGSPLAFVHARSYVAATMALALKRLVHAPLLFDIRGFWADGKVEGGEWGPGRLYRATKKMEGVLFGASDAVVSLTHAAKRTLEGWPSVGGRGVPIEVIPTCADLEAFRGVASRARSKPLTIGYVGSMSGRYLIDETVLVFAEIRRQVPDAKLFVMTPREHDPLWAALSRHGVPRDCVSVEKVAARDMPSRLGTVDATICLIKPGFASIASCPTKFGESLAAGAPVLVNPGIGDCAEIVSREGVGVVSTLDEDRLRASAAELVAKVAEGEAMRARCFEVAEKLLSLDRGVEAYDQLYRRLSGGPPS